MAHPTIVRIFDAGRINGVGGAASVGHRDCNADSFVQRGQLPRLCPSAGRPGAGRPGAVVPLADSALQSMLGIAKWITVLHQGQILSEGTMDKVKNDPKVIEVYLGH